MALVKDKDARKKITDKLEAKKAKSKTAEVGGAELFKKILRSDDAFVQFRALVKSIEVKLDTEEIMAEAARLHSGRLSRTLHGTTPGPEKLLNATLQDSSYRSRMVEVRVKLVRHRDRLDIALQATRQYLATQYRDQVSDLKTKGERESYFDAYLKRGLHLKEDLKSTISQLDDLVKDIDQTAYTYKNAIECLELLLSRNNDRTKS